MCEPAGYNPMNWFYSSTWFFHDDMFPSMFFFFSFCLVALMKKPIYHVEITGGWQSFPSTGRGGVGKSRRSDLMSWTDDQVISSQAAHHHAPWNCLRLVMGYAARGKFITRAQPAEKEDENARQQQRRSTQSKENSKRPWTGKRWDRQSKIFPARVHVFAAPAHTKDRQRIKCSSSIANSCWLLPCFLYTYNPLF